MLDQRIEYHTEIYNNLRLGSAKERMIQDTNLFLFNPNLR